MFLNTFKKEDVLKVYFELKENNNNDLMFLGVSPEGFEDEKYAVLFYDNLLHRIFLWCLRDGLLYTNPDCSAKLMPNKKFIENIKPSSVFNSILNG